MIDTRVRALLEACYEAIAAGDEPDLERLCADAPELRGTVERLLQREREFVAESRRPPEPAGDGPGLPQRIAEFTILDALGSGGMSRVYRARQEPFGREVALKVLRDEFVASGTGRLRFQREATITAALDHPHIVPVYAAGEADGHVYLAMKLLRGQSLERQPLPLPPADVARIGEQIASALAAAHEIGVVHRDVKPANIVLENDSAVVVDFGLSSFAHGAGTVTRPDSTPGTLIYLAPELVARRSRGLDPRVDVYGLGATLYEALAGHPPIPDGSPIRVLHAILHQEPAPLHLRGRLRDLETIVLRALDKSPQRRFQTAGEMAEELARHRAGLPIRSRPIAWHQRVWRLCRRHPTTALLSSVAAALLLTVALLLWLGARERERRFQRSLSGLATAIAEGDLARATRDLTAAGAACGARPELEALAGELADERRLQVLIALLQGPTAHKDRRALARLGGELGATAAARSPRADAALAIASRLVVDDPVSHRPLARATQLALPRTTAAMQAWSRGADVAVALAALPTTAATAVDHLFAALVLRIAHRGPAHVEAELRRAELRGPTADAVRYSLAVALEAQQAHRGALDLFAQLCERPAWAALANGDCARLAAHLGQRDAARRYLEAAVTATLAAPHLAPLLQLTELEVLLALGDLERFWARWQEVESAQAHMAWFWRLGGYAAALDAPFDAARAEQARSCFERGLASDPDPPRRAALELGLLELEWFTSAAVHSFEPLPATPETAAERTALRQLGERALALCDLALQRDLDPTLAADALLIAAQASRAAGERRRGWRLLERACRDFADPAALARYAMQVGYRVLLCELGGAEYDDDREVAPPLAAEVERAVDRGLAVLRAADGGAAIAPGVVIEARHGAFLAAFRAGEPTAALDLALQLRDSPGTPDEVLELARRAIAGGGLDLAGSASGWSAGRRRERLTEACGAVQDAAASGRLTAAEVAAVAAVWQRDGAIGEGDEWNALRQRIAELGRSR